MAISQELQHKMDIYEQLYCSLDKPVPFKGDLKLYPILVTDYYDFYSCLPCITADKNVKLATDENGKPIVDEFGNTKTISNPEGIAQNYLSYLAGKMKDPFFGQQTTAQFMRLCELIFHMQKGMYCPKCGKEITYEEVFNGMDEFVKSQMEEAQKKYDNAIKAQFILNGGTEEELQEEGLLDKKLEIPEELKQKIIYKARIDYIQKSTLCPDCENQMRDTFYINKENGETSFYVKNIEITPQDFDELKAIVPRQNIIDYDGDKYVDPDLKAELELKAKMQNKDYTSPTLEKQICCVAVGTGYTIEYIQSLTIRRLSTLLRLIDRKEIYYAQIQGQMSGMVSFKEDPKHWIFSDDKKNIKDELTSLDDFTKKFDKVT